ncbi:MAG TPA: GTPase Era [Acidimicrobiales bacterium]|nr:GTPase Era [Acidimicrobiales bacterium]
MRSGFSAFVGRPNVGKSTLLNTILGTKVAIVSNKPQTTRNQIRGILNRDDAQVVFVDTPGIHKPRTAAGARMNATASGTLGDVDVVCLVIDATAPLGPGDRFIARRVPAGSFCVVNKIDVASRDEVLTQLTTAGELDFEEYFPVSARTGEGIDALVGGVVARLPEGPAYYPDDIVTDVGDAFWVAELVREQLLAIVREELPHSIACVVTEWEWPRVRCEILVERDSQKGIVIGHQGSVLKAVGMAVRSQMEPGAHLELAVKVDQDWQRHAKALDRLGY